MTATKLDMFEKFKENGIDRNYDDSFALICENMEIQIGQGRFIYFLDPNYAMDTTKGARYENLTPAYWKILDRGLEQLKYPAEEVTNSFCKSCNAVLDSLILLIRRVEEKLDPCDSHREKQKIWLKRMRKCPAQSFEEAIQRLLFVNQMFWQTDHRLTGLGAWDSYLFPYYESDIQKGNLNKEKALEILKDLYRILHENYKYKSNVLMGDTGQIFVLGKSEPGGGYVCNELTYLFIEAMKEVQQSEPKCLLRVNRKTPRELLELALASITTGIGAPLLANDDVVIPQLLEFGIEEEDAYEYMTSACWEPLIGGKSVSQNNMTVLNYLKALDNLLKRERLENIASFEEFISVYLIYLKRNLRAVKRVLSSLRYQYDPLLSVFMEDCYKQKKDASWGGARYRHFGVTSVAMGDTVDALFNIREYVFEKKKCTLYDVKQMLILNFEGKEELRKELKERPSRYGTDDEDVVALVNRITSCVAEEIDGFSSYQGGRLKVGLSGAAYMDAARSFGASFNGRKAGEPFTVHISNEDNDGFTEIINFVSELEYGSARFNGNVVDLMVSPDFIYKNWEKFVDFLMICIRKGFFEMQMNVVSSKTLLEAREHPEDFPNLIVRVWGFSAYFKDLPREYQDVLIKRALKNEGMPS
jgi:pyruvate-formate lyase